LAKQTLKKILFVGDAHIPYHDKAAWALMLKAAKGWQPDSVVCLGDIADFFTVSSHSKDPHRVLRLKEEMAAVNTGLDQLQVLGAKDYIYIAGNHCDRLQRYLQDKAPELFDFVDVPSLLRLNKRGWKYVPYKHDIKIGELYATHDVGVASRYAVFRALETYNHSVVTGHTHRLQYVVEGDATGQARVAASFGWLGDVKQVDYMNRASANKNWALGFGIGYLNQKTGAVHLVPVPVVDKTVVVEGTLYEVT
jgi:predicted phosphodiesterase